MKYLRILTVALLVIGIGFVASPVVKTAMARPERPERPERPDCPNKPEKPGTGIGQGQNGCHEHRPDRPEQPERPEHPQDK